MSTKLVIRLIKNILPDAIYTFFYRNYFGAKRFFRGRKIGQGSNILIGSKEKRSGKIVRLKTFTSSADILAALCTEVEQAFSEFDFFPIKSNRESVYNFALHINPTAFNTVIKILISQGMHVFIGEIERNGMRNDFYKLAKETARPIVLFKKYCTPDAAIVFSDDVAIHIHLLIHKDESTLVCASRNDSLREIPITDLGNPSKIASLKKNNEYDFDVDAVFTWVDGEDPSWQHKRNSYSGDVALRPKTAYSASRFKSRDELKYALRSVLTYAPWIRNIYIVTDSQVPAWFQKQDKVLIVDHREIFPDKSCLPAFNSHAIETNLHKIGGLSECFLYFNDDFMLRSSTAKSDFFSAFGRQYKFFYSMVSFIPPVKTCELLPVDLAAFNNADLLEEITGYRPRRKFQHTPIALKRSTIEKLEDAIPSIFLSNSKSRFRHFEDYSIVSALVQHYGYFVGVAQRAFIAYDYIDLGDDAAERRLERVAENDQKLVCFCVNDVETDSRKELGFFAKTMDTLYPFLSVAEK